MWNYKYYSLFFFFLFLFSGLSAQQNMKKRQKYLEELKPLLQPMPEWASNYGYRVNYVDNTWNDWLLRTGELPPDFDSLPSIPILPDPLLLDEGILDIPVTIPEQWEKKKARIREQYQQWVTGTIPPPPENMSYEIISDTVEDRTRIQMIELKFGPGKRAKMTFELMIPAGEGPYPVFMTQWNHRGWAQIAVRRGYIGCVYAGADDKDDTEQYQQIFKDYSFACLMRRAWGASRVVDYLLTRDEVDTGKIAISGHSRNSKQSIMAAAFDERIAACITSSGGTGGITPWRFTDPMYDCESIDEITSAFPHWFHPRLRFFSGREHKLPVDQNLVLALIAPRILMFNTALTEKQANPLAQELCYKSVKKVYRFLNAEEKIGVRFRYGKHGTSARDIEAYIDFLDLQFNRIKRPWDNTLYYDYSFEKWKNISGKDYDPYQFPNMKDDYLRTDVYGKIIRDTIAWLEKKQQLQDNLQWLLGEEPSGVQSAGPENIYTFCKPDYLDAVIDKPEDFNMAATFHIGPYHAIGDYLHGNLYYPLNEDGKIPVNEDGVIPVAIYIHEYAYSTGYARRSRQFIQSILNEGYAVLAMDMIGFGTRIEEGRFFYQRYPHWSKLGKMVTDVRAAVDVLENLEVIDSTQIFCTGYALGGTVGLITSALDERIAGTSVVSGFTPLRDSVFNQENKILEHYADVHGLIPLLGFFNGHENRIPTDFDEIMACVAPRPLMVVTNELNRHTNQEKTEDYMKEVQKVYRKIFNEKDNLLFETVPHFDDFSQKHRDLIIKWLREQKK